MNSIGAYRFAALCVELLALCAGLSAADCPVSSLSREEKVHRLQQLDQTGQAAMRQHQYTDAIRAYREQSCLAPDSSGVFYALGTAEAASADFLNARKSFSTADRLEPSNKLPLAMLARVNLSMGDLDSLKATLRDAAARFPTDGTFHGTLAHFLIENKQYELALAESLRARQAGAPNAGSQMELAVLENTVGAYEDAIRNAAALEQQAGLPKPVRASAAGVAGLSYEGSGQREDAVSHLREAIRLDQSQENSYLSLAFILEKSVRYGDAAAVLEQGRHNLPNSTAILLSLGSDLIGSEQYQAGIQALNEFIQKSPDEPKAYLGLADAYRKTGDSARETQILLRLAQRKPDYPDVHVLIARAMLNQEPPDYPKVLEELDLAEKTAPADADVLYLRGRVFLAQERLADAEDALRRSIELSPMDPSPYYQLGLLYRKLGKTELARETLARMQFLKNNASK